MPIPSSCLIIDDEPHIRTFLRRIVMKLGVESFYEAGDGPQAIDTFRQYRPGLILLDINMPTMDGIEVLRNIRTIDAHVPVIMMTAQASRRLIEEAAGLGALQYIRKDTDKEEILELLQDVLSDDDEDDENV